MIMMITQDKLGIIDEKSALIASKAFIIVKVIRQISLAENVK